nr:recombinase family protein [Enterococcus faecalis]
MRPGFEQLICTIRKYVIVVLENIFRSDRNTLDILNLILELDQKQVQFVSVKENMNIPIPTEQLCYK